MHYSIQQHLAYNVWANQCVAETLTNLDEELLYKELKSSFTSIAKTLLHQWDAEIIWLKRMQGVSLNSWPSENFKGNKEELLSGFVKSSAELLTFIKSKDIAFLSSTISYKSLKGDVFTNIVADLLYHVVNHGTYHRGQIITLLHELDVTTKVASTDIILYLRSVKEK